MRWRKHVQRLGIEILVFFLVFGTIVYFATDRESIVDSIVSGAIGAICYGGVTYILRERTISRQRDSRR